MTRYWTTFVVVFLVIVLLMGCATPAAITTSCTPSSDLPAEKHMEKAPEAEASPERLYGLFVDERRGRAQDQRDYNSLYRQCVARAPASLPSSSDPYR